MLKLDSKLFYLAGVIVGDGHLRKGVKWKGRDDSLDYGINIHAKHKDFLEIIFGIINEKINSKTEIKFYKRTYYLSIRNKLLHSTLNKKFEIPLGKKSNIVFIPNHVKYSKNLKYFLAGLFDTDGGVRRGSIGYCSASKKLVSDISTCLLSFGIESTTEEWINKTYNRKYYGLRIRNKYIQKFLETIPLKNKNKIEKIRRGAGVVKRARLRVFK